MVEVSFKGLGGCRGEPTSFISSSDEYDGWLMLSIKLTESRITWDPDRRFLSLYNLGGKS